jgi:hypothetical protein
MDYKTRDILALSKLKQTNASAVVRQRLEEIENAMKAGVSREAIWKGLCESTGLSLSFRGFTQALYRARQGRDDRTIRQAVSETPEAPLPAPAGIFGNTPATSPRPGLLGRLFGGK